MLHPEARTQTWFRLFRITYHIKLFPVQGQKALPIGKIKIIAQDCSLKAFSPNLSYGLSHHWEWLCHSLTGQQREKGVQGHGGLWLRMGEGRGEPAIIKSKNSLSPTQKNTYSWLPTTTWCRTPGLWLAAKRNSLPQPLCRTLYIRL